MTFRRLLLFTASQSVDLLSTVLGLQRGMQESNPWLGNLTPTMLLEIKVLSTIGVLAGSYFIGPRRRAWTLLLLAGLTL